MLIFLWKICCCLHSNNSRVYINENQEPNVEFYGNVIYQYKGMNGYDTSLQKYSSHNFLSRKSQNCSKHERDGDKETKTDGWVEGQLNWPFFSCAIFRVPPIITSASRLRYSVATGIPLPPKVEPSAVNHDSVTLWLTWVPAYI